MSNKNTQNPLKIEEIPENMFMEEVPRSKAVEESSGGGSCAPKYSPGLFGPKTI
ncbi:hypothetical protein CANTEDRAFT_114823, partial [Yamadazyma tenuis ATCC 10573]